jgi:hypothetical protein
MMRNINHKIALRAQVVLIAIIWVLLLLIRKQTVLVSLDAIKQLPLVISIYTFSHLIFTKWGWKLPLFYPWLVPIRDLSGSWEGEVTSTSIQANNPISVTANIQHRYDSISILIQSSESESLSTSATLDKNSHDETLLRFTYTNRPRATLRNESPIHEGASMLRLVDSNTLIGEYWTSRNTGGEIKLIRKN